LVNADESLNVRLVVPIADPQAHYHNNHVRRERLTHPAWKRQVDAERKPLHAEIERARAKDRSPK